jgi:hypothetical protein
MARIVARFSLVIVSTALVCCLGLTLMTFVSIDKSRERTICLRMAQTAEDCSTPSWWEKILRRLVG